MACCGWFREDPGNDGICRVDINSSDAGQRKFCNRTSTTKYNILTFLPKALFEQYRRVANIYFTLVAALSLTSYSPVRPWTTFLPLVFVMGISIVKEAVEDYKRYRNDRDVNSRRVAALDRTSGRFVEQRWMDLCPGDMVVVRKDDPIPADLLLLCSSNPEGTCYIETMNLDGETNLKIKAALDATRGLMASTLPQLRARVSCELPNSNLYCFSGNLEVHAGGWGTGRFDDLRCGSLTEAKGDSATEQLVSSSSSGGGGGGHHQRSGAGGGGGRDGGSSGKGGEHDALIPVTYNSLLLRGCVLRNTGEVYGAVVYAGHDTKMFQNATEPPSKRSRIEQLVDRIILFMLALLFAFCLSTSIYFALWTKNTSLQHWYLQVGGTHDKQYDPQGPITVGLISFLVCFILYGHLIPISLYVSIEIIKICQSMVFINLDRTMYHPATDTPAQARTSNLNEELGMVNTVLSDKTGTLTCNVMEYFKMSIGGISYGNGVTEIERANASRRGLEISTPSNEAAASARRERHFNFHDSRFMDDHSGCAKWTQQPNAGVIEMFLRMLAVCHTVIPDGPAEESEVQYEAESPDEATLVVAAKVFGFCFLKRTQTTVTVRERTAGGTRDVEYEVLSVIEFNSTRKRMSVIVRDESGQLLVFCKGADIVIYERLDKSYPDNATLKVSTSQHMDAYASAGLRTLCLAYKELDAATFQTWDAQWREAKTSLKDREAKLESLARVVEQDLRLLGCTAIEDKLQDGVQDSIEQLAAAGIRLWVLTGDKVETAINIGFACSLITDDMRQFRISGDSAEVDRLEAAGDTHGAMLASRQQVERQLQELQAAVDASAAAAVASCSGRSGGSAATGGGSWFSRCSVAPEPILSAASTSKPSSSSSQRFAMVIDGKALGFAMSAGLSPLFLSAGSACAAVMCCRVSPLQKAKVTMLIRSRGDITLAIGDGANDVGMIQKAHIGVGLSGQEGMQAVMAADYAIAQFRFLVPLLLVHGRLSYLRQSRMICYFFYKNIVFGVSLFAYNAFTAFSGSYMYDDTYMSLYNVIYTLLVPLVIGIFDRDVDRAYALRYPVLYKVGQRNDLFGFRAISSWWYYSLFHAAVITTFILVGLPSTSSDRSTGQTLGLFETGITMFTVILLVIHAKFATLVDQWTWLHHAALFLSLALWWLFAALYPLLFPYSFTLNLYELFVPINATSAQYWLMCVIVPAACVLPDYFSASVCRLLAPTDTQIVQEVQRREKQAGAALGNKVLPRPPSGDSTSSVQLLRLSQSQEAWGSTPNASRHSGKDEQQKRRDSQPQASPPPLLPQQPLQQQPSQQQQQQQQHGLRVSGSLDLPSFDVERAI